MTQDEIREFLMGWLMQFGSGPVGNGRFVDGWCMTQLQTIGGPAVGHPECSEYFDQSSETFQLNQKGLDFIKGDT